MFRARCWIGDDVNVGLGVLRHSKRRRREKKGYSVTVRSRKYVSEIVTWKEKMQAGHLVSTMVWWVDRRYLSLEARATER